MSKNLIQSIRQSGVIQHQDCILIGLSGGPDSVCLLHALVMLREELSLTLYTAHLNHNLRGLEASEDAGFAMAFSREMDVHCMVKSEDIQDIARRERISTETAGRIRRYEFLEEVAEKIGANKIAVGHHLHDQAETLLMHLIRGSGLTGLAGMAFRSNRLIRPLLQVSRDAVLEYCRENQLTYRRDPTNEEPVVFRNQIRLELIPLLETYNPKVVQALGRCARLLREDEQTLDHLAQMFIDDELVVATNAYTFADAALAGIPDSVLSRVIRKIWHKMTNSHHTLQWDHISQIRDACRRRGPEKWFQLPGDIQARVTAGELAFVPSKEEGIVPAKTMPPVCLRKEGITWLPGGRGSIRCHLRPAAHPEQLSTHPSRQLLAADHLTMDLVLRCRYPGDKWQPLGMSGRKALKKTMMELGIPKDQRDLQLLFCHGDEILWVIGGGISEKARITSDTKRILVVEYRSDGL